MFASRFQVMSLVEGSPMSVEGQSHVETLRVEESFVEVQSPIEAKRQGALPKIEENSTMAVEKEGPPALVECWKQHALSVHEAGLP